MIDSHAHITNEFFSDIDQLVELLRNKNVIAVINCADSISTSKEVIKLYDKYNGFLVPAIGIHPEHIDEIEKNDELENLINNNIKAIGEIGLDYNWKEEGDYIWSKDNKPIQIELFNKQLDLAEKYNLPIIVHTRDAIQDSYDILKKKKLKGLIHCYNGSYEMAKKFIELGYKLGIGGVLTFKNSKTYQLIEKIDLNDILLETDSPFLAPAPVRGTKNIPSNIYYVAEKIALIKGISVDDVIKQTTQNAKELFDI